MKIAVDFDGTCVSHAFPAIGVDIGAVPVLQELVEQGHQLILNTMRSDGQEIGDVLTDAVNWFKENNIQLYAIGKDPNQSKWTSSDKCYAQLFIDDAALGCPLISSVDHGLYVDWVKVRKYLMSKNILSKKI